jgi:hypothetical protein
MFITVITDCSCSNAYGRQSTRISTLFGVTPTFVGTSSDLDAPSHIEASGQIIDMLDAADGSEGIILANVAPRGTKLKWANGTPFGYFDYAGVRVFSTVDGQVLSLAKKLGLISSFELFDIPTVMNYLANQDIVSEERAQSIIHTQFRSFNFLPRVAHWLQNGIEIPSEKYDLDKIPKIDPVIWYYDNFGNYKTTLLKEDLMIENGKVKTKFGELNFCEKLTDVPNGEPALTIGSSGLGDQRFVEIVVQKGRATDYFKAKIGDAVL